MYAHETQVNLLIQQNNTLHMMRDNKIHIPQKSSPTFTDLGLYRYITVDNNLIVQCSPLNSNPLKTNFCLIQILSDSLHRANA